jgi:phospholipid transport system substrate-binding protein
MYQLRTILVLVFLSAGVISWGASPQVEKLESTVVAALDIVYSDCCSELTLDEKQVKVREAIESNYDLSVVIRRAIGRNWTKLKASEQGQVMDLVKQLIVKAYVKGLDGKNRPTVTFGKVVEVSEKRMEIASEIELDGKVYNVLYRMGLMESGWQIYDIVAEDISVVSNYRQQFDDHFRKGNGAELITKLEELLKKEDLDEEIKL